MENFKGNSNASKEVAPTPEREKLQPITSDVTMQKQSEFKKFTKNFFAEDAKTVSKNIVTEVILPGIKRLFTDMVKNGVDWLIYGRVNPNPGIGPGSISYNRLYSNNYGMRSLNPAPMQPVQPQIQNSIYAVNTYIFNDRGLAEEVLLSLREQINRYGMVSVADFYDLISQQHPYTDVKYGWRDLSSATVIRNGGGYSIQFPKIVTLE